MDDLENYKSFKDYVDSAVCRATHKFPIVRLFFVMYSTLINEHEFEHGLQLQIKVHSLRTGSAKHLWSLETVNDITCKNSTYVLCIYLWLIHNISTTTFS